MLVKNIPFEALPHLQLTDTVFYALQQMQDQQTRHLAVTNGPLYAGMISENILLEADEDLQIKDLEHELLQVSVKENDHFLNAISLASVNNLSVIPVVNSQNELTGVIDSFHLLKYIAGFMHLQEPGGLVVLEIEPHHYSFSEISKIVETNDAQVTQLNTSVNPDKGLMQITIRVNKEDVSDIITSFQRYDYTVKYYQGEESYTNELKTNYENLMNYLNI